MTSPAEQMLAQAVEFHKAGQFDKAAPLYHQLLNYEPFNPGVLYLMGDICVRQGLNGLGINLLTTAVSIKPTVEAFTALGVAYKAEGHNDEALNAWRAGLSIAPSAELHNNVASIYADAAQPAVAHQHVAAALKLDPCCPNAFWNRSLAYLTERNWVKGWADHDFRFDPMVQQISTRRDYGCPEWDGRPGVRLAVHGEQGVGDEVMFLSMLPDVLARCPDTTIEVEPRLMDIVERTFGIPVYGNETAMKAHEAPFEMAIPLGSLGKLLRRADSDFPGTPYLKADPERVEYWRRQYAMQGPGPYIGIGWQGGTKSTRITQRTIASRHLQFTKKGTPISLQYGDAALVKQQCIENGYCFWRESVGDNMDEFFAMVAACDAVVTVPQTLVHVAGSLGVTCKVLTPLYSSWRYGMVDRMVWYGNVELYRQKRDGDWGHPLAEAKRFVDKLCKKGDK